MFGLSRPAGFCVNHLADAQADAPSSMRAFQAREPAPGESAISVTGSRAGEETTPRPVLTHISQVREAYRDWEHGI